MARSTVALAQQASTATAVAAADVEFLWKGGGKEVFIAADFLNWDKRLKLAKTDGGHFSLKQALAPGKYTYKFIVDGRWCHSPDSPTIDDGNGGFNNCMTVTAAGQSSPDAAAAAPPPAREEKTSAAAKEGGPAEEKGAGAGAAAAAKPAAKGAAKKGAKKAAAKPIRAAMEEDIIPLLTTALGKEEGLSELELSFDEDKLLGTFVKDGVRYSFWCYFPDKELNGARGFSLTSHGNPPSTVEPFLIDERAVTPDLFAFWVQKRLYAQKILSVN